MTLLLVWTLAFWVVNEAADALSFSNDYIGNHAELFDYTQDRQVIRPMSFTTVKQFLDQLGWVHSKDGWYPGYLSSANVVDPEGRTNTSVLQVTYGPGYFGQSTALGIAGWYSAPGYPYWNVTRMTLEYEVFFPTGFIFVKEGKLPGIWGADGISSTTFDCGGGSVNRSNPNCFSTRLMWRNATGAGAAYIYAVNNQAYCPSPTICPNSQVLTCCDPSYGDIVGRNFALLTGQWQKLAVMVDLQDGLTQVIHNGKVVISYIVKYGSIRLFNGIKFDTFFGGGSSSFSSPTTQYSYFRNFKLELTSKDIQEELGIGTDIEEEDLGTGKDINEEGHGNGKDIKEEDRDCQRAKVDVEEEGGDCESADIEKGEHFQEELGVGTDIEEEDHGTGEDIDEEGLGNGKGINQEDRDCQRAKVDFEEEGGDCESASKVVE
ncbi:unnamed protein product (mitochondrion) [Plasmodiophora brassicae]|uniref:Polysaccharide lyase 14 domain-containing protein n=1 Tax=Plasmodiophora brassicae TaxID=37360 RepID=A0A3P3YIT0_PLABS|nr:unnamed protein product [Plasmodiophora brassicae]